MLKIIKNLVSVFTASVMILSSFSSVYALDDDNSSDIIISGNFWEVTPFTLYANGDLVLSGTGKIPGRNTAIDRPVINPDETPAPEPITSWDGYEENIKRVIIEEGITDIGYAVFENLPNLTSVQLPESLESIDFRAFADDTALASIKIPKKVRYIWDDTFSNCISLEDITISSETTEIMWYAFDSCSENLVLKSYRNSLARQYADVWEIKFEAIDTAAPIASVKECNFAEPFDVALSCDTPGAVIYYTVDGSEPDYNSTVYAAPIRIADKTTVIKAFADAEEHLRSKTVSFAYIYAEPDLRVPTVETKEASDITYKSAVLCGAVNDIGSSEVTQRSFTYWEQYNAAVKYTVAADNDFTAQINNLSPDCEYYYYASAANAAGGADGEILLFKTDAEKKPNSISVSPLCLDLKIGEQYQILAEVLPVNADNRSVIWSSSDKATAEVDNNGKVTALKEGTVVITATTEVNRLKAYCTVNVYSKEDEVITDFSEWNMATNTSDFASDGLDVNTVIHGGNYKWATAYLARWDGAVKEENDPYREYSEGADGSSMYEEIDADYHVNDVIWIPPKKEGSLDYNDIKKALMKYGAVYTSYRSVSECYGAKRVNHYYDGDEITNHAVAIVGWDDNYPASNFVNTPPGNGAFICKNSWGEDFGADGYFYISYYDTKLNSVGSAVFLAAGAEEEYNKIYQYDPLGITCIAPQRYGANVFPENGKTMTKDETLKAVSFYTYHQNTQYEIYVIADYQSEQSLSCLGEPVISGMMEDMGYHTVNLKNDIALKQGTRFAVAVKLYTPGETCHICCEHPNEYRSKASAGKDESYLSHDGINWIDATTIVDNMNVCLKAFTDTGEDNVYYQGTEISSCAADEYDSFNMPEYSLLSEDEDIPIMGVMPDTLDIEPAAASLYDGAIFPEKYDLRDNKCVTPIRDQGRWGTCWAHAVYASLESCILKKMYSDNAASSEDEIKLDKDNLSVALNSETYLNVMKNSYEANRWISSDETVAVVDTNGKVTAVGIGEAVITAETSDGKAAACQVRVSEGSTVEKIELSSSALKKSVGDIFLLDYDIYPSNASDMGVTWESDNPAVAEVNENGKVTAVSDGSAVITVKTDDGNKTDQIFIMVGNNMTVNINDVRVEFSESEGGMTGSVYADIEQTEDVNRELSVILAVYDEHGVLREVRNNQITESNTVSFDGLFVDNTSGGHVKVFVWDGIDGMYPQAAAFYEAY
ncbi:MAG: lectin like domain-containing protein [Candidatus Ornithomonoglobus sp.]